MTDLDLKAFPHDEGDCLGTRCPDCGCCMHSTGCAASECFDSDCGCYGRHA